LAIDIYAGNINIAKVKTWPDSGNCEIFYGNSIRKNQGSMLSPAGNMFIGAPVFNIDYSQSPFNLNYFCNLKLLHTTYPFFVSSNVSIVSTTEYNGCPSKIKAGGIQTKGSGEVDIEGALAQYDQWNREFLNYIDILDNIDAGDEEMINEITDMIAYYSALKDNYFNAFIVAVMNNNEKEMMNYDTLRFLFAYRGQYHDYLSIVETYLRENDFNEALVTIANMHKQFELTNYGELELDGLQTYIQWRQDLYNSDLNIDELSNNEIEFLLKYVVSNVGRGVVFANNILCALYNICKEDEGMRGLEDEMIKGERRREKGEEVIPLQFIGGVDAKRTGWFEGVPEGRGSLYENITLVPNPTTGELQVTSYELRITSVDVYDIYGKKQLSNHLITPSSHHKIDISYLSAGIYFVKITTEQGEVVKKVIKQ